MELARNLITESVSRLNPTPPHMVSPQQTVSEAVDLMRQHKVGCLLVQEQGKIVGIFTERDLLRRILAESLPLSTPLAECMTRDPVTVDPQDPIGVALRHMEEGGYRHLPVINSHGDAEGILSVKRIVHYLAEHFPSTIYNQPPNPGSNPQTEEGA